ncbi:arylsulfatase [Novipirellula artificiosorum]|uniref:Arylsulfatase n=1 Tax=Novipirellula artificiosorum TaxID=2528016 RepID=A0A5C6DSA2_9BACT|nr:arylsulfatase [Novipirellula artificiosorum]TWU38371.1 Arylsulfatase [Novipirellula artificiosorum]
MKHATQWILSSLAALVVLGAMAESAAARRPNVVVILTDDQGWGDLSINGNTNLSTPHVDSLAAEGARLEHFYVCQVCAPTRAEFLTGRYYPRTGVSGVSRGEGRLNAEETTIADVFKSAGYATGAFGKWHNGTQPPLHPNQRGFDEYYGFTSGHWGHYFSPPLDHNGTRVRGRGFIVDDFTEHAIDFINDNQQQPFFCYLPLNTPHSPMMVPDAFYEKFKDADLAMRHRDPDREDLMMTRAALAMCENIDWNVGRVLKTLDELGLREETIVVYFSDNGPNSYRWNQGMKGKKGSLDEGGLRSPLFIRWPDHIRAGASIPQIAGAIDLLPTLADLANIDLKIDKPLDGTSLQPLLLNETTTWPSRMLFAAKKKEVSVRTQRFRLDSTGKLFDIDKDPGQHVDVSEEYPKAASELRRKAQLHAEEMNACFDKFSGRPFHVGYGPSTTLPARDGEPHGAIQRSAKAPNNSFFKNWTNVDDYIHWPIDVGQQGDYEAIVYYTCAAGNEGARITLSVAEVSVSQIVHEVFDPPLYDKSKERVENSHYFVKDFKPLPLGVFHLNKGSCELRLGAETMTGSGLIDVHSIDLILRTDSD